MRYSHFYKFSKFIPELIPFCSDLWSTTKEIEDDGCDNRKKLFHLNIIKGRPYLKYHTKSDQIL